MFTPWENQIHDLLVCSLLLYFKPQIHKKISSNISHSSFIYSLSNLWRSHLSFYSISLQLHIFFSRWNLSITSIFFGRYLKGKGIHILCGNRIYDLRFVLECFILKLWTQINISNIISNAKDRFFFHFCFI